MTKQPATTAFNLARWVVFGLCGLIGAGLFRETINWLVYSFNDPKQDMGHGWLVPLFSLYLLWTRRQRLSEAVAGPSLAGLACCGAGVGLLWLGARGDQVRITHLALIWLLWSIPYALWGRGVARLLAFPVLFLCFTIPMAFLDFFTVRLRLFAAAASDILLNGIGIPVTRTGTGLQSAAGAGFNLDIADPCSGLRSIFAMMSITAAYAYLSQPKVWQRWLLFACSVPLAVIGNMVRIFTIAVVAKHFGQKAGAEFHDYSGYLVFVVAVLLMLQTGSWIGRLGGQPSESEAPPAPVPRRGWRPLHPLAGIAVLALVPVLLAASFLMLRAMPRPVIEPQDFLPPALPASIGAYRGEQPWFCQDAQCLTVVGEDELGRDNDGRLLPVCRTCGGPLKAVSLAENTVLPADTLFMKRNYFGPEGTYRVTVVVNGESRMSIHRPELCLPSQGFSMDRTWVEHVELADGSSLPVKLVDVRSPPLPGGRSVTMGQAYWFVSAHHRTASHMTRILTSAVDRSLRNRVTRWAMVTIAADRAFDSPQRRARLESFIREWHQQWQAEQRDAHRTRD